MADSSKFHPQSKISQAREGERKPLAGGQGEEIWHAAELEWFAIKPRRALGEAAQ